MGQTVVRRWIGAAVFAAAVFVTAMAPALAYVVYGPTITGIWGINPVTGTSTKVYTFATQLTSIAAIAQRQSDGMIFFIDGNTGNNNVYRWDPSTPSTAPVLLGTTGSAVPYLPRLGFDPNSGILYGMDTNANPTIWQIDQNTGAATSTGKTVGGLPSGGGDFVIDTDGTWYIAVAKTLYKTATMGGSLTTIGTIGSTNSITGLALGAGNLVGIDSSVPSQLYTISKTNASATNTGQTISDGSNSVGDLAGIFQPDLTLTKSDNGGGWTASFTGSYTLTATNIGNQSTSGTMTLTDSVPSGLTVNSVTAPAGWTCTTAQTVTCTSNAGTSLAPNASASFTINITVSGSQTSVTNSASIAGGSVPSNLAVDGQSNSVTTSITQSSSGLVYVGPYDAGDANLGSQYTGSYDGVQTASNEFDFTAANIPFPNGTSLVNTSTTPGSPAGAAITAASVTFDVANSLYYDNTANGSRNVTLSVTVPSGWTAQICADNAGTAVCGGGTVGACASTTWQSSAAGQTATAVCSQNRRSIGKTRFWVRYTTPASGLLAFTRYDAIVTASEPVTPSTNATHNELYSGFVALTKNVSVVSTGCPAGVTPAYANGTCPGGVLLYAIDYRNIIAGAASEPTLTYPQTSAGTLTITEPGAGTGSTWPSFTNGLKEALIAGANGTTTFGDSTAASVFTNATIGSLSFTDKVGGASFKLLPQGIGSWQGTLTFRVVVK